MEWLGELHRKLIILFGGDKYLPEMVSLQFDYLFISVFTVLDVIACLALVIMALILTRAKHEIIAVPRSMLQILALVFLTLGIRKFVHIGNIFYGTYRLDIMFLGISTGLIILLCTLFIMREIRR
jgi:hypothetical protein